MVYEEKQVHTKQRDSGNKVENVVQWNHPILDP